MFETFFDTISRIFMMDYQSYKEYCYFYTPAG